MSRRRLIATAAGCVVLAAAAYLAFAQTAAENTERVTREIAAELAAHAAQRGATGELPEDNSLCLLCHANFRTEEIVAKHLEHGVTCVVCHGISFEHMNDETSRTRPDVMFGRAEVARFCRRCHGGHKRPDRVAAFLQTWKSRTRPNGRLILQQAMCTDCHGTHVILAVPEITAPGGTRE